MRHRLLLTPVALVATALAAGCSTTSAENTSPTSSATTVSASTTRTPRITDDSGRAQVAFDPCLDLSDEQINRLGYQPGTRRHTDYPAGDYTFLSCSFKSTNYLLGVGSGNVTFAEEQTKEADNAATAPTTIDGRQALVIPSNQQCTLAMHASYGIVILTRTPSSFGTKMSAPPCEGIEDTARLISQFMPKGT